MPTQLDASVNSVWSLFVSEEPQVVLCETEHEALTLKAKWEASVHVLGPFEHPRHELPLVQAAADASLQLEQLATEFDSTKQARQLRAIRKSLIHAIRSVYPFDSVALPDGSSWNLKSKV